MSTSKQMKYIDSTGKETIVDIAVNAANVENNAFTQAAARTNIASGETLPGIFGKLRKWFADLKAVAWSGKYSDLTDRPALGTAAAYGVANDCGTTAANYVLDARQGQVLQANINQVNSNLYANVNAITGTWLGNNKISFDGANFYVTAANGIKKKLDKNKLSLTGLVSTFQGENADLMNNTPGFNGAFSASLRAIPNYTSYVLSDFILVPTAFQEVSGIINLGYNYVPSTGMLYVYSTGGSRIARSNQNRLDVYY